MRLIPAIDIIDGKCVRLSKGDYNTKVEYGDPLEMASRFEDAGIQHLHLVDLDGAKAKQVVNLKILERICAQTQLQVDFGGGVKSDGDLRRVFDAGASQITAGSIAVSQPETVLKWLEEYGPDKIILGADVRNKMISTNGWLADSDHSIETFLDHFVNEGISYVISTDIAKDGMLQGPSISLYKDILTRFPDLNLIASGGVSNVQDLYDLKAIGCEGAIVGKAIYENQISLTDLQNFNGQ